MDRKADQALQVTEESAGSSEVLARAEIPWIAGSPADTGKYLQLMPHVHGTDGFFAAVLERAK